MAAVVWRLSAVLMSAKGKPNRATGCIRVYRFPPLKNASVYRQDTFRLQDTDGALFSVVTKCRKLMLDSAEVVRKYILILWYSLLHR